VCKKSRLHTRIHSQWLNLSGFSNGGLEFCSWNVIWGPHKWPQAGLLAAIQNENLYYNLATHVCSGIYTYLKGFFTQKTTTWLMVISMGSSGLLLHLMYQNVFVTLFLTFVFHFNFVPRTTVIAYFKFYCRHINIFVAFWYVLQSSI
jgi:hypothetical protein